MNGHKHLKATVAIAFIAATLTTSLAQQAAAEQIRTERVVVNYADLDLGKEADVHALYERIVNAAGRACGDRDQRDARAMRDWRQCSAAAIAAAVAGVDSDPLDALYAEGREVSAESFAAASLR